MIAVILFSAGLAYFLSLPFASVLQSGGYRIKALLRAKRQLTACGVYLGLSLAAESVVCLFTHGVARCVLTFVLYVATSLFVFCVHRSMKMAMHYTHRLVRLLILFMLLYIAVFICLFFTPFRGLWGATPSVAPFLLLLTSFLISPFEKRNNRRYIEKAKEKLSKTTAFKIGITGSYGKTGVKHFLDGLLRLKYNTLATPENFNTPAGIAKTMQQATGREQALVLEMGARHTGDIKALCDIVHPNVGIITGIAPQHLETFKSVETIMQEKNELANAVPNGCTVFYNLTDHLVRKLYDKRQGNKIGMGYDNADYILSDIEITVDGSTFVLSNEKKRVQITTPCVGLAAVIDLSIAAIVAAEQGVSWESIVGGAKRLYSPSHRFEVVRRGDVTVIDDSYNINPVGAAVALDSLCYFQGERKIVYTSGIVELGVAEEELNFALGKKIASTSQVAIVCEGRYGDAVTRGIKALGGAKVYRVRDTQEATALFENILQRGDVLLIMSDLPREYML